MNWIELQSEADQKRGFRFTPPAGEPAPTRMGVWDRLFLSTSDGSLPLLLLLGLMGSWTARGRVDVAFLVVGIPLLVWFLRPLLISRGRWVPLTTALAFPVLATACSALMVTPVVAAYRIYGVPLHSEILAVRFQTVLELTLTWASFGTFVLLLGILWHARDRVEREAYWIQPARPREFAFFWRTAVLVSILFALIAIGYQTRLSARERSWLEECGNVVRARPFFSLTEQNQDHTWQGRVEGLIAGDPYVLRRMTEHPPTSQRELEAASAYLFRGFDSSDDPMVKSETLADYILLTLQRRPNGDRAYLDNKLDDVAALVTHARLTTGQLQRLKDKYEALKLELFTREEELDLEAYRTLWLEDRESERAIGWYSPEESFSWQPEQKHDWTYNGVTSVRGLVAFGKAFDWSPTGALKRYQKVRLTRQWLRLREEIKGVAPAEQRRRFESLRDGLGHLDSREHRFWDSMARENQVVEEAERLDLVTKVLANRLKVQSMGVE